MLRRVLLPLSGSSYTPVAIRYAAELAHQHGAWITALAATHREFTLTSTQSRDGNLAVAEPMSRPLIRGMRHLQQRSIERLNKTVDAMGIPARLLYEQENLIDSLLDKWPEHDLTVIGLLGLFERDVLDNAAHHIRRLLTVAPTPLLAVSDYYRPVQRVLIGYNTTPASQQALESVLSNPLWPDATYRLVSCGIDNASFHADLLAGVPLPEGVKVELAPAAHWCDNWEGLRSAASHWDADIVVLPRPAVRAMIGRSREVFEQMGRTLLLMN